MEIELKELAATLYDIQAVKFGDFKTKIGMRTPVYFDLRVMISHPKIMSRIARALWKLKDDSKDNISRVCGVPYMALPLATVISVENNIPMLVKRKEAKSYGTMTLIEGKFLPGDDCVIIEDVITSGSSILETTEALRNEQLKVSQAFVIIDREQGARDNLEKHGIKVKSLYLATELMKYLFEAGKVTSETVKNVNDYLSTCLVPKSSPNGDQSTELNSKAASPSTDHKLRLTTSYETRATLAQNESVINLLTLMARKQTNLCLAADLTQTDAILKLAELAGPHIAVLKTHVDIIEDFNESFIRQLKELARRNEFLLMEDRKFGDIGNTVKLQYKYGIYKIAEWADLITVHPLPGKSIIDTLKNCVQDIAENRGIFLIVEMSCEGALISDNYLNSIASMISETADMVVGFVSQSPFLSCRPNLVQLTPGVKLSKGNDELGQRYNDPQSVIDSGADLVVVGRGITEANDQLTAVLEYKKQLWQAYEKRINKK